MGDLKPDKIIIRYRNRIRFKNMPEIYKLRERLNLTQEELAERSGLSVRTIQRIEAGLQPKGYTLRALAKALETNEQELLAKDEINLPLLRLINLSSLPFTFIPPFNILAPLILMIYRKQFTPMTKQIVTIQILWTVLSAILFMISIIIKNLLSLGGKYVLFIMLLLISSNLFIILRNAAGISKDQKIHIRLKFSLL
jgi:transcriptional regulator with XRE-family HTH domain